ncbi:hypothetical protein BVRB_2g026490 isoform A [Beta vulgaris subsp. vulgaris]|uniref:uncharacterized protein LOC104905726 isoform X2 n=1 Tax=Beta vulgaris subsp. vulgaris TaxID=3555 RepID=UPI00053FD293|nr:uncharacterized protein LOC104905726 isoform X2 [Beta vulgaris subsp. vulgaris]KMT18510.1 hypothetical protein BVRB_2g026490 isoform A [Beta vulgaris subsp. vulgaris]
MEGSPLSSQHHKDQEFNLREWHLRARISRDNTNSRRHSASYIRSFREESGVSFKSNFTISSTASSPGYHLKDEIDPSTYSFTTALKALQAKSGYLWECVSPEGFSLNSKWDEAERYICNPLSGEVPMECLSAKTLSGRSFRSHMASRVTMSAPLIYSMKQRRASFNDNLSYNNNNNKPPIVTVIKEQLVQLPSLGQDRKIGGSKTRDVGTQSTPPEGSSSSPSPTSTPSIKERMIKRFEDNEDGDTTQNSSSSIKLNPVEECTMQVEVKITREKEETKRRTKEQRKQKKDKKKTEQFCICRQNNGCFQLSWSSLWMNKRREGKKQALNN